MIVWIGKQGEGLKENYEVNLKKRTQLISNFEKILRLTIVST